MTAARSMRWAGDGWLDGVGHVESPNCDERPPNEKISLVVIHAISLPPTQYGSDDVERFFTNRLDSASHPYFAQISDVRVSSHFFIRRDGMTTQFVSCDRRAWHAGVSVWNGRARCNDFSIGIELEGCDTDPFDDRQYAALSRLLAILRERYPIADVAGHSDIAPQRKTDPGPFFDWHRLPCSLLV